MLHRHILTRSNHFHIVSNAMLSPKAITKYNGIQSHLNTGKLKCNLSTTTNKVNGDKSNNRYESIDEIKNKQNMHSNVITGCLPFNDMPSADSLSHYLPTSINTALSILTNSQSTFHLTIDNDHKKFGSIFRKKLGPIEAVFINSPNLMRDVFKYEGRYPKHPLPEAWTFYNQLHDCKRGLFFMDDDEWLQTRKILAPLMLLNDNRFESAVEKASDDLITNWLSHINGNSDKFVEIPNILETMYHWSICVLLRIMFGQFADVILRDKSTEIEEFAKIVENVFEDTVPFQLMSPQLARKLHLKIWNKFENSVTSTLDIANDIIDYGIRLNEFDGLLNDLKPHQLTETMIKRIFTDLIIAAGDTTAFTSQWALYLLSQNIGIQTDIRAEIEHLTNQRDTPLVRGTVREALRMYPVATFVGRILGTDAILDRYKIDKYTLVLISNYSAGRNESNFPNANCFQPSRWNRDPVTGALSGVNQSQGFIPYALGARNCIGQRIANAQMQILLTKIMKTFELKLVNDKPIHTVMRLIIMPNEKLRFAIKKHRS